MKFIGLFVLITAFWINSKSACTQNIIVSNPKSIYIDNAPELVIESVIFQEENDDNEVNAGEKCSLEIGVRNTGRGLANTVNIDAMSVSPETKGFSFSSFTSARNILEGSVDTFQIKLFPQISMLDGSVRLKIRAVETNGYDSKPAYKELSLRSKSQSLAYGWVKPWDGDIIVQDSLYVVKGCIVANDSITSLRLFLNDTIYSDSRSIKLTKSNDCDYALSTSLILRDGINQIYVELGNNKRIVTSEIRLINFKKELMEHRQALVIGNANYSYKPLKNPPNDAREMAMALRKLNFEVIELIDGTKEQMIDSLRKFRDLISANKGTGLFYYSGHGAQIHDENFLIPINHHIERGDELEYEAVSLNRILDYMQNSGTSKNIIILDACRDNPYPNSLSLNTKGLANINRRGGSLLIAYATSPGSVADDGIGKNGLYTQELLKVMNVRGLEMSQILIRVQRKVEEASNGDQIPWYTVSGGKEFYFIK